MFKCKYATVFGTDDTVNSHNSDLAARYSRRRRAVKRDQATQQSHSAVEAAQRRHSFQISTGSLVRAN